MSKLDRAFIKAYASRRPVRSTSGSSAAIGELTLERGDTSYRVDAAHVSTVARTGGPHIKSTGKQTRRPASQTSETTATVLETPVHEAPPKQRIIVSVADNALVTTDWIWQRQPSPVFADQASTAEPLRVTPSVNAPSTGAAIINVPVASAAVIDPPVVPAAVVSPPAARPVATKPSGKLLSPEVLSLGLSAPTTAPKLAVAAPAAPTSPLVFAPAPTLAPLSAFSLMPRIEERLQPALEVDHFLWPDECTELSQKAAGALERFAEQLVESARCGQRRVALVGASAGAGTTTTALCLAGLARSRDSYWSLLDGDFAHATLARQVGIAQTGGWETVLAGQAKLAEVSIASLDDHLILVPLAGNPLTERDLAANFRAPSLFSTLAEAGELLLVDGGSAVGPQLGLLSALVRAARIDAVYLVYDERSTSPEELAACAGRLKTAGITPTGAIGNFAAC